MLPDYAVRTLTVPSISRFTQRIGVECWYSLDPSRLIARSILVGKPVLVVNINYRLNMFAFGDETSEVNLALRDQRYALEYISLHIAGFGGDPVQCRIGPSLQCLTSDYNPSTNTRRGM